MVADPHHFNAIRIHIFTSVRIRILLLICDTSIQTLQGSILSVHVSIVSLHGPPRLHIQPTKLHIEDPDPTFTLMRIRTLLLKILRIRTLLLKILRIRIRNRAFFTWIRIRTTKNFIVVNSY